MTIDGPKNKTAAEKLIPKVKNRFHQYDRSGSELRNEHTIMSDLVSSCPRAASLSTTPLDPVSVSICVPHDISAAVYRC